MRLLADNGYPDAFVDLMYVATGTDAHLEWVERLLARVNDGEDCWRRCGCWISAAPNPTASAGCSPTWAPTC